MDGQAPSKPKRRWHQCRGPRYLAVLLAACVVGYFSWDALFMPEDLKRLQGSWKIARLTHDGKDLASSIDRLTISGRTVEIVAGQSRKVHPLDIVPDRCELSIFDQEQIEICGLPIRWPIWLKRPVYFETYHYDLRDTLVLRRPPEHGRPPAEIQLERID